MRFFLISLSICIGCQAVQGNGNTDFPKKGYGRSHLALDNSTTDIYRNRKENPGFRTSKQEKREYGKINEQHEEEYEGNRRTPSVHHNNRYRSREGTNTYPIIKQQGNGHRRNNGYYNREQGNRNGETTQHLNGNFYNKDRSTKPYKGRHENNGNPRKNGYQFNGQKNRYGNNRQQLNQNLRNSRYQNKRQDNENGGNRQQLKTNRRNNRLGKGDKTNGVYNGNQHNLHRNRYRNRNRGNGRRNNRYQFYGNGRSKTFRNSRQQNGFQDIINPVEGNTSLSENQIQSLQNATGRRQATNTNRNSSFENGKRTTMDDSLNHQVSNGPFNNDYDSDKNGYDVVTQGSNDTYIDTFDDDDSSDEILYGVQNEENVDFGHSRENGNHQQDQRSQNNSHKPKLVSVRDDYNKYNAKDGYIGAYRTSYTFYK